MILCLSLTNEIGLIKTNYDESNFRQIEYLQQNIQPDDIILFSNIGIGGVVTDYFESNTIYFYNPEAWGVEEAYEAYAPQMTTITDLSILDHYSGRIWLIDSDNLGLYYDTFNNTGYQTISIRMFDTAYAEYIYQIVLLEKR